MKYEKITEIVRTNDNGYFVTSYIPVDGIVKINKNEKEQIFNDFMIRYLVTPTVFLMPFKHNNKTISATYIVEKEEDVLDPNTIIALYS
jgi:hypothetical protein